MEELNNQFVAETDRYLYLTPDEQENLGLLEIMGDADSRDFESDDPYFDLLAEK